MIIGLIAINPEVWVTDDHNVLTRDGDHNLTCTCGQDVCSHLIEQNLAYGPHHGRIPIVLDPDTGEILAEEYNGKCYVYALTHAYAGNNNHRPFLDTPPYFQ